MELKPDLIIKSALFIGLGVFIAKIGANLFMNFKDDLFKPKNSLDNLDSLIEQKKQLLRTGQMGINGATNKQENQNSANGGTWKQLLNQATDLNKQDELKAIIVLFEEASWGEGPHFEKIRKQFFTSVGLKNDIAFFTKHFRQAASKNIFENITIYSQFENQFLSYVLIKTLMEELQTKKIPLLTILSDRFKLDIAPMIKSAELFFMLQTGQARPALINYVLKKQFDSASELSRYSEEEREKLLLHVLKNQQTSLHAYLKTLKEEGEFFQELTPLPPLKSAQDLNGAYNVLGLSAQSSLEEIKKKYHDLILKRHPDKLKMYDLPATFKELANHNFILIQKSYEIIQRERKKHA